MIMYDINSIDLEFNMCLERMVEQIFNTSNEKYITDAGRAWY